MCSNNEEYEVFRKKLLRVNRGFRVWNWIWMLNNHSSIIQRIARKSPMYNLKFSLKDNFNGSDCVEQIKIRIWIPFVSVAISYYVLTADLYWLS